MFIQNCINKKKNNLLTSPKYRLTKGLSRLKGILECNSVFCTTSAKSAEI